MHSNEIVKMDKKGKITIPVSIRKKYQWKPGAEFKIIELDAQVSIIPINNFDNLPKMSLSQYSKIYDESQKNELELEN